VIDILIQPHQDQRAAERFFRGFLRSQDAEPLRIITDKPRSYSAAMRTAYVDVTHSVERYADHRARSLASADPPTRTANAPIRICTAGPTVSFAPRCRPQSVPSGPALIKV
jgi:hypothetical protein